MSNKNKPTLTIGKHMPPAEPHVHVSEAGASCDICFEPMPSTEPIKLETEEFVSIAGLASQGRDNLIAQLRAHAAKTEAAKEYVPPAPTGRQLSQLELEMAAGRRGVAKFEAQFATRPQPKPDVSDGYTTPVFRPGDSVPGFDSKDPAARTLK